MSKDQMLGELHPEPETALRALRDIQLQLDFLNQEGCHFHWQTSPLLAAYEAVRGWAELFLHRKTIVWVEGQDPILPALAQRMVREGFKLKSFKKEQRTELLQFLVEQQKAILCVLYSEWHWLFDTRIWLESDLLNFQEVLEQNKLLSINLLYHLLPEIEPLHPFPFTLQIFDLGANGAVAFGRAKSKYSHWLLELSSSFTPLVGQQEKIVGTIRSSIFQPNKNQRENWVRAIEEFSLEPLPPSIMSPSTERQYSKAFLKTSTQWQKEKWPEAYWLKMCQITDKSLAWLNGQIELEEVSRLSWVPTISCHEQVTQTTQLQEKLQSLKSSIESVALSLKGDLRLKQ